MRRLADPVRQNPFGSVEAAWYLRPQLADLKKPVLKLNLPSSSFREICDKSSASTQISLSIPEHLGTRRQRPRVFVTNTDKDRALTQDESPAPPTQPILDRSLFLLSRTSRRCAVPTSTQTLRLSALEGQGPQQASGQCGVSREIFCRSLVQHGYAIFHQSLSLILSAAWGYFRRNRRPIKTFSLIPSEIT